ncbi:ABC transporter ATP-binding protein [Hyphococcus flavus]|uniref:ABC transporter ATP-binding protein n=1 Tax=Hyphococcus flavus TaxID=1866326 RepID=A0AAF0CH78_9PROT|nr:ABC transporter ATP-binding protein [Hyphococcus flavus]WDI33133.1 ABC transporter ATP-binding protein [Hyphococcus flavus]
MTAIETENLRKRFRGVNAVDGVDLSVPEGAIFGFLGPNGAGKTTTIRLLLGLLRPNRGRIALFGENLKSRRTKALKSVGVAFETPAHYEHLTGRENLDITRRLLNLDKSEIDRVLETVELKYVENRLVRKYSLGMRHRLGLARALLGRPKLLIFDEPTNGLDPVGIREMREFIKTLPERTGATVFVSSHHLAEIEQMASHVAVINLGQIVFQGDMKELRGLHAPRLELACSDPGGAASLLSGSGKQTQTRGGRLVLELASADEAEREAAEINRHLVGAGFDIHHLAIAPWTLEELFLQLVGAKPTIRSDAA